MIHFDKLTEGARNSLSVAQEILKKKHNTELTPIHLLKGLVASKEGSVPMLLNKININLKLFENDIDKSLMMFPQVEHNGNYQIYMANDTEKLFEVAENEMERMKDEYLGSEHLFIAMFEIDNKSIYSIFEKYGITKERVYSALQDLRGNQRVTGENAESNYDILKKYTRDFTEMAKCGKLDPVIGREKEIMRVIQILSRRTKNNPVLIGEPGVGKTAIVEGLALKIIEQDVPENLENRKIVALDIGSLVAGTQFRGEFEQRLKLIIDEIVNSHGNIILFIDELHTIVGAGNAEGAIDASNMLKPRLARGEMQTIGATTLDEYRKYIEKDGALERRFQPVIVNEPSIEETVEILEGLKSKYEDYHKVKISSEAILKAAKLSSRYLTERKLPDKAVDLIDEAAARLKIKILSMPDELKMLEKKLNDLSQSGELAVRRKDYESAAKYKKQSDEIQKDLGEKRKKWLKKHNISDTVTENLVAEIVSEWTGIPVYRMVEKENEKLINMEKRLHQRVIGQNAAIKAISDAIRRSRAGLSDPKKPIGTFLFVGPTGVGKTELVKALTEFMFDKDDAMLRIDMSEYMEKFSISRLIGAPPGYVGYEEGGQLTEPIRRKPFSVILLDEIEKAHNDIYNILLQVMDDGRLTDGQGHIVDFRNTIIIMTSNIGSRTTDFTNDYETVKKNIEIEIRNHFKPEFINRIDEIIVFNTLNKKEMNEIVHLQLKQLAERSNECGITIEFDDSIIAYIAENGYREEYGARPVKRLIQNILENQLSHEIIKGNLSKGDKAIIRFNKKVEINKQ